MGFTKEMENVLVECSRMSEIDYNIFLSRFEDKQQEIIKQAVFTFKMMSDNNFYKAVEQTVGQMVYNHYN